MTQRSPVQRLEASRADLRPLLHDAMARHALPIPNGLERYPLWTVAALAVGWVWWARRSRRTAAPGTAVRRALATLAWRVAVGMLLAAVRASKR